VGALSTVNSLNVQDAGPRDVLARRSSKLPLLPLDPAMRHPFAQAGRSNGKATVLIAMNCVATQAVKSLALGLPPRWLLLERSLITLLGSSFPTAGITSGLELSSSLQSAQFHSFWSTIRPTQMSADFPWLSKISVAKAHSGPEYSPATSSDPGGARRFRSSSSVSIEFLKLLWP